MPSVAQPCAVYEVDPDVLEDDVNAIGDGEELGPGDRDQWWLEPVE